MSAKTKLKNSKKYKDVYITNDYARAIQMERKILIKAMFKAKESIAQNAYCSRDIYLQFVDLSYHLALFK